MPQAQFLSGALKTVLNPMDSHPTVVIMSGLEGSVRSEWCRQYLASHTEEAWRLVSMEDHRRKVEQAQGIAFAATFDPDIERSVYESMDGELKEIRELERHPNVMVDASNLSGDERGYIASFFPGYRFVSIVCLGNEGEIKERLAWRQDTRDVLYPGKRIHADAQTLWRQLPKTRDGFDEVRIISEGKILDPDTIRKMKYQARGGSGDNAVQGAARV